MSVRRLRGVLNLEDFGREVGWRLPRAVESYVSGGVEEDTALARNRAAFRQWGMVTRVLRGVAERRQSVTLFGREYASPFGIAPMGASAVVGYDADNRMARAAQAARIPFILSANSITPVEELARTYPGAWFNAYLQTGVPHIEAMCARVQATGLQAFVLTVDVPTASNRENNVRNGYSMPLRLSPRLVLDAVTHPWWLARVAARTVVRRGMPAIANVDAHARPTIFSRTLGGVTGHAGFAWREVEVVRRAWRGPLVLKGILSAEDARIARESGADGIVVSNHGGRQLDAVVAPIEMLAEAKAHSGEMTVFVDSGFRRGTDVLTALALGADAVLLGRPFLFAATLAGEAGVAHAIRLLTREIDIDMAQLGLGDVAEAGPEMLVRSGTRPNLRNVDSASA